jgi:diguanylate cyclase (GGDEF)-like protein
LALAQRIRSDPHQPPGAMLAEIDTCRQWLSERAADAPFNYLHMSLLVDAERAWAVGDTTAATAAFDAALTESETRSRPWHHALIAERAALYHLEHGLEYQGRTLITEARRRYDAWGATAKVAQLDRAYPFLRGSPIPGRDRGRDHTNILRVTPDTTLVTSDALDLLGLLQASQALSSERSLDRLRARVVDTLSEMTGATSVQILMWDNDIADWVKPADVRHGSCIPVEEAAANGLLPLSAFRYAERTREPLLVNDATRDYRFAGDRYFKGLDRCSLLVMPVLMRGDPRAMLVLENNLSRGAFPADRLAAVNLIVGQLSVSLDNALIYSSLERKVSERTKELEIANGRLEVLAETDALTGLANRRRLIEALEVELLRSLRTGSSTGIIMMDIDFFKAYNDRYGHVAGDDCLRRVADALQRSVRSIDVIARYGGEEFAVVLPDTDLDGTYAIAERARSSIIDLHEQHLSSPQRIVTVSVGIVSQTATRKTTAEQLLDAADGQLYQAKRRGRNQIRGS